MGDNRYKSYRPEGGGIGVTTCADHADMGFYVWR
jgi:hypothetical protein